MSAATWSTPGPGQSPESIPMLTSVSSGPRASAARESFDDARGLQAHSPARLEQLSYHVEQGRRSLASFRLEVALQPLITRWLDSLEPVGKVEFFRVHGDGDRLLLAGRLNTHLAPPGREPNNRGIQPGGWCALRLKLEPARDALFVEIEDFFNLGPLSLTLADLPGIRNEALEGGQWAAIRQRVRPLPLLRRVASEEGISIPAAMDPVWLKGQVEGVTVVISGERMVLQEGLPIEPVGEVAPLLREQGAQLAAWLRDADWEGLRAALQGMPQGSLAWNRAFAALIRSCPSLTDAELELARREAFAGSPAAVSALVTALLRLRRTTKATWWLHRLARMQETHSPLGWAAEQAALELEALAVPDVVRVWQQKLTATPALDLQALRAPVQPLVITLPKVGERPALVASTQSPAGSKAGVERPKASLEGVAAPPTPVLPKVSPERAPAGVLLNAGAREAAKASPGTASALQTPGALSNERTGDLRPSLQGLHARAGAAPLSSIPAQPETLSAGSAAVQGPGLYRVKGDKGSPPATLENRGRASATPSPATLESKGRPAGASPLSAPAAAVVAATASAVAAVGTVGGASARVAPSHPATGDGRGAKQPSSPAKTEPSPTVRPASAQTQGLAFPLTREQVAEVREAFEAREDWRGLLQLLEEALLMADAPPDRLLLHLELAQVKVALGVPSRAVPHYEEALELVPEHAEAIGFLRAHYTREGLHSARIQLEARLARRLEPRETARTLQRLADDAERHSLLELTRTLLIEAQTLEPSDRALLERITAMLEPLEAWDILVAAWRRHLPLIPQSREKVQVGIRIARYLKLQGDLNSAERLYRGVLRTESEHAEALEGLAEVLEARGEWSEVAELWQRRSRLLQGLERMAAALKLASLYGGVLADPEASEAWYREAMVEAPRDTRAIKTVVRHLEQNSDFKGLARFLEERWSTADTPAEQHELLLYLGDIYLVRLQDQPRARACFQKAEAFARTHRLSL